MTEMLYNKLVRDKIPEIIAQQGESANIRVLSDKEYTAALEQKLDEETREFHKEKNLEELADILEVVYALADDLGCTKEDLLQVYNQKHEKRGGFQSRIFLISKEG